MSKAGHFKEVVLGAMSSFMIKGLAAVVTFLFYIYVGRIYGAEESGVFFLCLTILTITSVIGKAGLENTLLRYVASNYRVLRWDLINDVFNKCLTIVMVSSTFISIIVYLNADILALYLLNIEDGAYYIRIFAIGIMPLSISAVIAQGIQGLKHIKKHAFILNLSVPLFALLMVHWFSNIWGLSGLAYAYISSIFLTLLVAIIFWRKSVLKSSSPVGKLVPYGAIFKSGIPLFWVSVMQMTINWSSFLVLGVYATESDVGVFGMAVKIVTLLGFVLMAVNSIAAPKFADMYKHGDFKELEHLCRKTTSMLILLVMPVALTLLVIPGYVMGLFGQDFALYGLILQILVIGQVINVGAGSVGILLIMSGKEVLMRNNLILTAAICLVLNFTLVPLYGLIGAAFSYAIVMLVQNVIAVFMARKYLNILTVPYFPNFKILR